MPPRAVRPVRFSEVGRVPCTRTASPYANHGVSGPPFGNLTPPGDSPQSLSRRLSISSKVSSSSCREWMPIFTYERLKCVFTVYSESMNQSAM